MTSPGANAAPNSADRIVFWSSCSDLADFSDAELDRWADRGVGGFACVFSHLHGMGGVNDWQGDPRASLAGPERSLQRRLEQTRVIHRARARGIKVYLGFYLMNYWNKRTPLEEWFDDRAWSRTARPALRDLSAAAHRLGFAGVAMDHELYPQDGGAETATWAWDYPGNTHPERAVRAQARRRGREVMAALLEGFPGVEVVAYDVALPETWMERMQKLVNNIDGAYRETVHLDFWNGLTAVEGYGALRLFDATFYKGPHLGSWDAAMTWNVNRTYALLSRRLSNWEHASRRLNLSPFAWIDAGPCTCDYDDVRPPNFVSDQLQTFRKWGMGGEFGNFAYAGLRGFDYRAYEPALRSASRPGTVDREPPSLVVRRSRRRGRAVVLTGTTHDNLAIRAVRIRPARGREVGAAMTWRTLSGDARKGFEWRMSWSARVPLAPGRNRLVVEAEDIKGLIRKRTVIVRARGASERRKRSHRRGSRGGYRR